jgi:adenosylcobinamide-phosphate synthase
MAAMALALGVRLGKPGVYVLNASARDPGPLDTRRAAQLGSLVALSLVPVGMGAHLLVSTVAAWMGA